MSTNALLRLEEWLQAHPLGPEQRLPAERRLSDLLGLSRAELRKALATVESEGRLIRHVGRGTFLRPTDGPIDGAAAADGLVPPVPSPADGVSPLDLLGARVAFEPELARLAAVNADGLRLRELSRCEAALRAAASWARYEVADTAFHRALAEAAGNAALLVLFDGLVEIRRAIGWGGLLDRATPPSPDHPSHAEHAAVTAAIAARDRHGAADALRRHLAREAAALTGGWI